MNQKKYKNPLLIILFLTTFYNTFAQWVPTTPVSSPVYDFFELDNKLYCTAYGGTYYTTDVGKNWIRVSNSGTPTFDNNNISSTIVQNGIIYGILNASIWKSANKGKTWKNISPQTFWAFAINNNDILAIIFNGKKQLKFSKDTGNTWVDISSSMPYQFNNYRDEIVYYKDRYFLLNEFIGKLYYSDDEGQTWLESNLKNKVNKIMVSDNQLFASNNNELYLTNDNGINWVKKNIPVNLELITARGDTLYAPSDYGTIYRSYNKGDTWTKLPEDKNLFWASNYYKRIYIHSNGQLFAPSTFGLKISKDKGENWYSPNTQSFAPSYCWGVDTFKNRIIASFGDYEAGACISDDKGFTWANDYPIRSFYDIQVTDKVTYLCQFEGFFTSSNNGSTWVKSDIDSAKFYSSIGYLDSTVLVITDKGIYKSIDDGKTWQKTLNNGVTNPIIKLKSNANRLFGVSQDGNIYFSEDKSEHWIKINSLLPNFSNFKNIYCFEDIVVAAGFNDLFISKDNGTTWKSISNGLFYSSYSEITYYNKRLIVGGTPVYISNEEFTKWYELDDGGQMYVNDNKGLAIMNGELFLATRYTGLFKRNLSEILKVANKEITASEHQKGIGIYPNPVHNILNITVEKPLEATIYTITGKEISTHKLTNQQIDVSALQSGCYLLKVKNKEGVFSQQFVKL